MARTKVRKQFAALPYRLDETGMVEMLLVTSRETGRWVLPKGWPMKGKAPHRAAAIEAYEEAGAVGRSMKTPLGTYRYDKRLKDGAVPCVVTVYPMAVEELEESWPEMEERRRVWRRAAEAATLVDEPDLQAILRDFAGPPCEPAKKAG